LFLAEIPQKGQFSEYLFCPRLGENDGGDRDNWCLRQVYQFSFPAPSPTLALISRHFGGRGICGTVSELRDGVEHKFSDLPRDEACLVLGSYFLRFLSASRFAGWRKTILISVRSTGPRPLVLVSASATGPDCWAGDR